MPGLSVLALHGSRATGEAHPESDWDFAYLGDATLDRTGLHLLLCDLLGTDAVDLADLDRSSAVLRWQVARSGVLVHEREADAWHRFRERAVAFWCDMAPVIRAAQQHMLDAMAAGTEVAS